MSVNSPPQLNCNPLTEGFIYSPLHPNRINFIEEGIKADKLTKNEKRKTFHWWNTFFLSTWEKTAFELIIAE